MNKNLVIVTCIFLSPFSFCLAQKPVIDTNAVNKWQSIRNKGLSSDGNYFFYTVSQREGGKEKLTLVSINPVKPIAEINGASNFNFTANKNVAVYIKPGDSLTLYNLTSR